MDDACSVQRREVHFCTDGSTLTVAKGERLIVSVFRHPIVRNMRLEHYGDENRANDTNNK